MYQVTEVKPVVKYKMSNEDILAWRMDRIARIKLRHPIYATFEFEAYSNEKIAEMFRVLVLEDEQGDRTETLQ